MTVLQNREVTESAHVARNDLFAVALAILRIIRRMSQSELAEAAGVTNSAISDYERGKVDPQSITLQKLFRGLDLSISVLEETHIFILRIRSQIGMHGPRNTRFTVSEQIDVAAINADEREIWAEVAILTAEGGQFAARFIRLLFLTLFWMARVFRRALPLSDRKGERL